MTITKWIGASTDATTKSSRLFASGFGRQMRALGWDLALPFPHSFFMARERIRDSYLQPQTHVHVWLEAVAVFGPL